ncbi:hypothetical protein F2Q69_00046160 [Brassica cretica]|uniref:Uncharacterized protein n=1 Tax=Brassica cretica TaxID=69181 RepID=A0A8S9PS70_BRACR|nr:hypothetical protein F2Q69_00046160 [Brassica cretica]
MTLHLWQPNNDGHDNRLPHCLSIETSSMTTCSGGSEHCPHRSFAQPSWSKKSDRNQKYVDDNSPETVRL